MPETQGLLDSWPVLQSPVVKIKEQWLLFSYIDGQFTPSSKPLKTKQLARKARLKYPERQNKTTDIAAIRLKPAVDSSVAEKA